MLYHLDSYGVSLGAIAQYGWMGVDLFFVLSGYLIGGQLLQPYARGQQPRWSQFMLRRALRVLPAYLTVLAFYVAVPAVRESEGMAPLWQFLTFSTNLFADYSRHRAYSQAWSLCVEEHFYLLLPAAVWLFARKPGSRRVVLAAGTVVIAGMVLRGWLWQHELAPYLQRRGGEASFLVRYVEAIYTPTWTRLDGLLAGVMLAAMQTFRPGWWARTLASAGALLVAGVTLIASAMALEPVSLAGVVIGFPMLALGLACVLPVALSSRVWIGRLALPGVRTVATLSFSLYLTHKQAYHWIQHRVGPLLEQSDLLAFAVYNGTAFTLAALLYLVVERPALRLRDRLTRHPPENASAQPLR